jgi:hypothetical protein
MVDWAQKTNVSIGHRKAQPLPFDVPISVRESHITINSAEYEKTPTTGGFRKQRNKTEE